MIRHLPARRNIWGEFWKDRNNADSSQSFLPVTFSDPVSSSLTIVIGMAAIATAF